MNFNYFFTFLLLSASISLFSMQSNDRFNMKIFPVNNTNSSIKVTGMTGRKPRIGEDTPWHFKNFDAKDAKKAFNFGINGTMRIETEKAIFEFNCPKEMPGWLFAFGTIKETQEQLEAKKIQFSLTAKSKIKVTVNDENIELEHIPQKEYVPKVLKTSQQLPIVFGN